MVVLGLVSVVLATAASLAGVRGIGALAHGSLLRDSRSDRFARAGLHDTRGAGGKPRRRTCSRTGGDACRSDQIAGRRWPRHRGWKTSDATPWCARVGGVGNRHAASRRSRFADRELCAIEHGRSRISTRGDLHGVDLARAAGLRLGRDSVAVRAACHRSVTSDAWCRVCRGDVHPAAPTRVEPADDGRRTTRRHRRRHGMALDESDVLSDNGRATDRRSRHRRLGQ